MAKRGNGESYSGKNESVDEIESNFGALIHELRDLRGELTRVKRAKTRDRIVIGVLAFVAAFSLFNFKTFKTDVNQRSVSGCNNFNADTLDKRAGLKTLIRGITPANVQNTDQAKAGLAVFDAFIDKSWKFRDCSDKGIERWRKNTSKVQVDCKGDENGLCEVPPAPTIPPR